MDKEELDRELRQIELDDIQLKRQNKKAEDNLIEFINTLQHAGRNLFLTSKNRKAQADIDALNEQLDDLILKYQRLGKIYKKDLITYK